MKEKTFYILIFAMVMLVVCACSYVGDKGIQAMTSSHSEELAEKQRRSTEVLDLTETTAPVVETTTTETETTTEYDECYPFDKYEVEALCQMVYGEAQTSPREQKRWVAIVALNHYDKHCNGGMCLWDIVTDRSQFVGYSAKHPVTSEIWEIVTEVIADYNNGKTNWVDYYYFNSAGDGINNNFR